MSKAAELASLASASETALSNRNIVINGAMQISQRATSVTGIGASSGYFTLDRYNLLCDSTAGRLTMTQTADGPSGFANCLKLDCTTADTSIAAAERFAIRQSFEGQDLQQFKKGTSDAEDFQVSFYAKANGNFTYVCGFYDVDNNRTVSRTFAVTSSWQRFTINFGKDTTGAFGDDNASSLQLRWYLHAGSNYTGGTLQEEWGAVTNNETAGGMTSSFFSSTDNTFFLTGVQLEVGTVATPFEHRSFGQELALCQRYFEIHTTLVDFHMLAIAQAVSSTQAIFIMPFLVTKRTAPTVTFSASGTFTANTAGASNAGAATAIAVETSEIDAIRGILTVGSGLSAGNASFLQMLGSQDSAATVKLDSEL